MGNHKKLREYDFFTEVAGDLSASSDLRILSILLSYRDLKLFKMFKASTSHLHLALLIYYAVYDAIMRIRLMLLHCELIVKAS